ncbi:MAG TPA: AAA family ATPase [Candidatus Binatia bacterium]|nr:AAA family ATPase [Candidatus Binatia bacterium]
MTPSVSNHLYEKHFGFLDFPFSITPDPRFSYNNALYREAFATLRYGIEARKGFIVITGEVGTGKTTLLKAFMQSVESTVHTAFIFNPKLSFSQLVRSILTDLGIAYSSQDRFSLMGKFKDYLIEQLKKDHIVALLIDEAQDLSDKLLEEIRLLSNLETDSNRLIQIVLMGQPEFERRLNQPQLRQLKQRIALRCRLTPLSSDEVGSYINYRLRMAGYQGKELFEAKAVEKIILSSQGIPRLINVICDNALLIAYASSKRRVSAEMIDEVVRDLKLTVPSRTHRTASVVDFQRPRGRDEGWDETREDEPTLEETRHPKFEEFFMEERPPELYPKSRVKGVGIGILLILVLITSIGAVIFSQQDRDFVPNIAARIEDYSEQSRNYLSELAETIGPQFQKIKDSFSDAAANIGDYFPQGRQYLSGLAVRAEGLVATQWQNLQRASLLPQTSQDSRANNRLADSLSLPPNDHPTPAAEEPTLMRERSNEADLNKSAAPVPDSKTIAEPQTQKTPAAWADEGATRTETSDHPKTQAVEPQMASPESDSAQLDRKIAPKKEQPSFLGNFEVIQDSFLRDKPESDAAITTLPPGTWVRVESKNGDYLRVRSLNDPGLRGYVHREDAFFERIR